MSALRKIIELQSKKRLRAIFVLFILLFGMVILKLFHVQIIRHEFLKTKAEENWDLEIPFGGMRGNIIDRNGDLIVGNQISANALFYAFPK